MIELKITGELIDYIDTDELQKQAESDVRYFVKDAVSKIIKEDESVKNKVLSIIIDKLKDDVFNDELIDSLRKRILEQIKNMSDFDLRYDAGLGAIMKELMSEKREEFYLAIKEKLENFILKYEIDKYDVSVVVKEILSQEILKQKDKLNIKEIVDTLVQTSLESLIYK